MKKNYFIGIDVSMEKLDVCLLAKGSELPLEELIIKNEASDIQKYFKRIIKKWGKDEMFVCLEHTGHYGLLLCAILQQLDIAYAAVPALEIKRTQGISRGKTDKIDARRIATYAWRYEDKLKETVLPSEQLILIKELVSVRDQFVKMSTQLQNSLKSHQIVSKVINNAVVIKVIKSQITQLKSQIEEIEQKLVRIVEENESIKKNYDLLKSVNGIGPVTAIALIVSTHNFQRITDGRKFNTYTGIAPFENKSGKTDKGARVSNLANKKMKALLHNGACSAIAHDEELKVYYKRKLDEGKHKMSVLNAIACKLVYRAFAVIKRQTPYVNLYQHKFA